MHCSVLMSAFGITPGSKSCNYNKMESRCVKDVNTVCGIVIMLLMADFMISRWEELSGDLEVCSCCSSQCEGLKHLNMGECVSIVEHRIKTLNIFFLSV